MCDLMLKLYISVCNFCAKICDLIKNNFHLGRNKRCQEVKDGYNFVNIFV